MLSSSQIVATVMQEDQPGNYALREEIRQNKAFAQTMPFMILLISATSMFITMSRLVRSQRGEIRLAKALGYGDGQIVATTCSSPCSSPTPARSSGTASGSSGLGGWPFCTST